jgi:hypothetical protein
VGEAAEDVGSVESVLIWGLERGKTYCGQLSVAVGGSMKVISGEGLGRR